MNQGPNVLMYGWELPPQNTGGLGVACYGLTKSLAGLGAQIAFALPKKLDNNLPFMEIYDPELEGVEITAINSLLEPYGTARGYINNTTVDPLSQLYAHDLYEEAYRFAEAATRWSAHKQFDLIHGHDWMTYPAGMMTAAKRGKPFVAHVHATEYDRTGGYVDSRIAEIEYHGLNKADKVIAVSNYTKNVIMEHYGVSADKIVTIHNGLDPASFSQTDFRRVFKHERVVLFVGRLTFQKGLDYFLQAAARVLKELPDTVFIVAGDGDMYQQHLLESAYLGISHRVIFTGFLKGNDLKRIYRLADVFVMPSVSEPFGIAALEAIASGKPVIASKNTGMTEVVHSLHTVDFWDVYKMAALITQSLLYPKEAGFMNTVARQEIQHLSWDNAAQKTLSVYKSVL